MRISRADSALVEECARVHEVSSRAVRDWRKKEDPRWAAFLHSRAKQSTFQAAEISGPALTLEQEEEQAARRYSALAALADAAIARGDTAVLPGLLRSAEMAHALLHKVRENVRATRIAEGGLVKSEAAAELVRRSLGMLRMHLENLPIGLMPLRLRPDDPQGAARILDEWVLETIEKMSRGV
jgi:hypothetical protein